MTTRSGKKVGKKVKFALQNNKSFGTYICMYTYVYVCMCVYPSKAELKVAVHQTVCWSFLILSNRAVSGCVHIECHSPKISL